MKSVFRHFTGQPFVVATGLAALVHSTWSIATYFSGPEPTTGEPIRWLGWAAVAFLIAFSMDVGQIVTSAEIRAGQRTPQKYLTFAVFALATYYCQFLYISSHMPQVPLAAGMRSEWAAAAQLLRDAAAFVLPALLPASTLLYTFSHEKPAPPPQGETAPSSTALVAVGQADPERIIIENPVESRVEIECDQCDWAGAYDNPIAARNALTAHRRKHALTVSSNGHQ